MFKKYASRYTLICCFSCLLFLNLFAVQQSFSIDAKCKVQLKQSLDVIHNYYKTYKQQSLDELCNYEFDDPPAIKKSVKDIDYCLSNSFFTSSCSKNDFVKKYIWLIKNNDPIIKEAAAYYYSVDLSEKNALTWKLGFIDEYFSLLKDRDINVRRAAFYSLSWITLKHGFHQKMEDEIYNKINEECSDPFILGYKILSFAKFKNRVYWDKVQKYYEDPHRFVRLCVIKSFRASVDSEFASSWAYGLAYDLRTSLNVEKLKDFTVLCSILRFSSKYSEWVFNLAWHNVYGENKKTKISGLEVMTNILTGDSVKIGSKFHIDFFDSGLALDVKRKIYNMIVDCFDSDDVQVRETALNLCAQFAKGVKESFDLEVIQDLAINGFDDSCIGVKIAAVKIFNNLVYKNFDLKTAANIAQLALKNKDESLKKAGRELSNILNLMRTR